MATGRDLFSRYGGLTRALSAAMRVLPRAVRLGLLVTARNLNGLPGLGLRYVLLRTLAKSCGDNVAIYAGVYLFHPENLRLGSNVSVHPMCYIDAAGGIDIGDDVSVAHGVTIMSSEHGFHSLHKATKYQALAMDPVTIGDNVWIGARAVVTAGVTIASGGIVGAASVVTRSVEPNTIVAGVPARKLRDRAER